MSGFQRFILWDYPRAGWQYDVMVGLILAFIFITPRDWFRDQPRASSVVMVSSLHGASTFYIEPELLAGVAAGDLVARATELVNKSRSGKKQNLLRLEPIFDSEKEIKGYMAFTAP